MVSWIIFHEQAMTDNLGGFSTGRKSQTACVSVFIREILCIRESTTFWLISCLQLIIRKTLICSFDER